MANPLFVPTVSFLVVSLLLTGASGQTTTAPSPAPSTAFPTGESLCYACGDPSLTVDPTLSAMLGAEEYECRILEAIGLERIGGAPTCDTLQLIVPRDCGCRECANTPGFTDSFGDDCVWYLVNGCDSAYLFANDDGVTASDACCGCGGGSAPVEVPVTAPTPPPTTAPTVCTDTFGFLDSDGDDCSFYESFGCDNALTYTNTDGVSALDACCICKSGGPPTEVCYVCGDANLAVDPSLEFAIGDDTFSCATWEALGLAEVTADLCNILQTFVPVGCNCSPRGANPTPPPAPVASPPTVAFEPCHVCGDPDLIVDPSLAVKLGDEILPCVQVEEDYSGDTTIAPLECSLLQEVVLESCNCRDPSAPEATNSPAGSPMVGVVPRDPQPSVPTSSVAVEEDGGGTNPALYALAALALIPIAGVIIYYMRTDSPASRAEDQSTNKPVAEVAEVPPSPGYTTSTGYSPDRHRPDPSMVAAAAAAATASGRSEGTGGRPTAIAFPRNSHAHHDPSSTGSMRSEDDNFSHPVPEDNFGSRQSNASESTPMHTAGSASASGFSHNSGSQGGYTPTYKDQARSVAEPNIVVDAYPVDNQANSLASSGASASASSSRRAPLDP